MVVTGNQDFAHISTLLSQISGVIHGSAGP